MPTRLSARVNYGALALVVFLTNCATRPPAPSSMSKGLSFLQREVPAWKPENGCYSCHNNGDAARALLTAARQGRAVSGAALADTLAWLTVPGRWDKNQGDPGFSDQRLANLQFALALQAAHQAGRTRSAPVLKEAARLVAADQGPDGSWPIEPSNLVGSPATYGTAVATVLALRMLRHAGSEPAALGKAQAWLSQRPPVNVPTAAALLLAPAGNVSDCLLFLQRSQASDGGWGPYADSPPEPYDTALALLGLSEARDFPQVPAMLARGRAYLQRTQRPDGSWPATTRPPGGDSYAQEMSTTAWAVLALLATDDSGIPAAD